MRNWIAGQEWDDLTEEQQRGCLLLANRFNAALDRVCSDIATGDVAERDVTGIGEDFEILDDGWLFGSEGATPESELAALESAQAASSSARVTSESTPGASSEPPRSSSPTSMPRDGIYEIEDLEDGQIVAIVNQALVAKRRWAVEVVERHRGDTVAILAAMKHPAVFFEIQNGQAILRLKGG